MPVGELFLSAFIQVLFQQLAEHASMALANREKAKSHFKKLSYSLSIIQGVLDDAEEKQLSEQSVRTWLGGLRDLAYDLDDLLDEITARALIQNSEGSVPIKTGMVWKFIPTCSSLMPGAIVSNYRIMSNIKEIKSRLEYIVNGRIQLNLKERLTGSSSRSLLVRTPTSSIVKESQVFGRREDKEAIIEMLLGPRACNEGVSVIPIVGMGGIGKTTLAQLVYNDRKVGKNFHVRAWACVSEEFDVVSITKTLYESVTQTHSPSNDLDMLQVGLKEKLSKSKFFIVLDDVWNETYGKWDDLYRPFQFGLPGSKIIVTTRNVSVASVVGSPRSAYHMKLLTDDDCLSLMGHHAQRSFDKHRELSEAPRDENRQSREAHNEIKELREIGLGLAKRCKGLPLAAKTLGGLLRQKETKEEWIAVLKSKVWDLPFDNDILPVLRLSYHHLPSHLKHLFAYCSIFPKDYEFDRKELVLLWMGEGFLEQVKTTKTKEELGLEYFHELVSRSFFQPVTDSDNFVMHDLINDLAQFVAGGTCYRLDEKMDTNQEYQIPDKTRHGSFPRHEYEVFRKFEAFKHVRGLRTFLPMPVQNSLVWPPFYLSNKILVELVPELHSLRVLSVSGYSITEVPSLICKLIHLRYLNLSGTSIVTLPDNLSDLFQLQTLSLSNCRFICKLPPTLGNLSNLRHLDNSNTDQLRDMPVEIGNLKNLQTLPKVFLSKDGGLGLRELRNLEFLKGTLAIFELQNVSDVEDVKEANLRCKKDLDELQLTWGSGFDSSRDRNLEEEVIDLLQPHHNLKSVKIEFYGGLNFPGWIGDPSFKGLSSIGISNCPDCASLPPLGQLPELKHLRIAGLPKVKCIGAEFYGSGVADPFPKLETLMLDHMPQWEKWTGADDEDPQIRFPHLQKLAIFRCSKLTQIAPLSSPVLRELDLEQCSKVLLESFCTLDSLNYLKVEAITGLCHLPEELMQSFAVLEVLECCNCDELLSIWADEIPAEHLTRLRRLVVADCSQLASLGQGERQLPCNLEVLELFLCANLITLPNDLSNLPALREVIIKNCIRFTSFPENGIPPMLKRLEILSCNALESLPSNIADLERLEIKECPSLRAWTTGNFPVALKKLSIKNCTQLEPVSDTMFCPDSNLLLEDLSLSNWLNFSNLLEHLHAFSLLVELYLSGCHGLKHFPEHGLPPSLRSLSLEECATLKSLPARKMRTMTSMVSLEIRSCPRLDDFPKCDLPPNLSSLRIWDSKKFKPLTKWGLHRLKQLREFSLCGGFRDLELLGDDSSLFPHSLIKFSIARFPNLTSLSKVLENLTSLRHLSVMNCGNLKVLPSRGLLEKLWHLEISDCPLLKPMCLKDTGDYWPKIAGIPCVEIDGIYVYRQ